MNNLTVKQACMEAYNNPLKDSPGRYKIYISIEGTWYFYNPETNKIHVEAYTEDNMEPYDVAIPANEEEELIELVDEENRIYSFID